MKIVKIILVILVVLVGAFLVTPLFIDNDYQVERSTEINAPAGEVYALVADYSQRTSWDPWHAKEPNSEVTITGNAGEKGAVYHWKGNEIGEGEMTTLEMVTGKSIHSRLDFIAPMEISCDVHWTFTPSENGTTATWAFSGTTEYPWNIFNLQMDGNIGGDFEAGLANLKKKLEG